MRLPGKIWHRAWRVPKVYLSDAPGLTFPPIAPVAIMASSPAEEFIKRHFGWFSATQYIVYVHGFHSKTHETSLNWFIRYVSLFSLTLCWQQLAEAGVVLTAVTSVTSTTSVTILALAGSRRPSKSFCASINTSTGRSTGTDCRSDTVHGWTDHRSDTGKRDML